MRALSQTPHATRLLDGPVLDGVSLGHGHLRFADSVLTLTPAGALRMPNGLECDLPSPEQGAPARIGAGRLECDGGCVEPGPLWDPRPVPRVRLRTHPGLRSWQLLSLAGQGPGLTPLGDDIICGYLAASALFGGGRPAGSALAGLAAARTTTLSSTLLRLATHGCLPEAAHRLLEEGDPEPLFSWGATSGSGLTTGLGLFGAATHTPVLRTLHLMLPLDPPRLVTVEICMDADVRAGLSLVRSFSRMTT